MFFSTKQPQRLFSGDDNSNDKEGMIDRIISRTDNITAKELSTDIEQETDGGEDAPSPSDEPTKSSGSKYFMGEQLLF